MADATTAAKDRIDRALNLLERKVQELKTRQASALPPSDDDLFASNAGDRPVADSIRESELSARITELEAAGQEASEALRQAADQLRALTEPTPAQEDA